MAQKPLFYDDWKEAVSHAITDSGREFKDVALELWGKSLKPGTAYAKLKACLDENGDEKLGVGELLALMQYCGQYDPLYHLCDETFHARPAQITYDEEALSLEREIAAGLKRQNALLERLANVKERGR